MAQRRNARYGLGHHEIDTAEALYDPTALVALLRTTLTSPKYEPPLLPAVAMQLVALTNQPDVSRRQVRLLLEQDSMLAAKVLRLAQSAAYSGGADLYSLDDAIARLGLNTVADLFLQTALSAKVFRAKGFEVPMEALRRHCVVTAYVARAVCRATGLPDEYAFLCGLLHDVGTAAGMLILAKSTPRGKAALEFSEVSSVLLAVHEEASLALANAWKLPNDVRLVIGNHHHFEIGGRVHPLAAAVCVADWVAAQCGARIADEVNDVRAGDAARHLTLTPRQLDKLLADGAELAEKH